MEEDDRIFADAVSRLDRAAAYVDIDDEALLRLKTPKQVLEVAIPVRMDDGALRVFQGYRVRHDDTRGPTKGGVIVDPKQLSRLELERLSRGFVERIADFIGPEVDVPAPDVYSNSMIMGWMMDEYSKIRRQRTPAVITGKPIPLGGSLGRDDATGRGAYYCVKELERIRGWAPSEIRVAVQGFGNAGQHVARLLHADGYRIVAVSDSRGGVFRSSGLKIPSLIDVKNRTRSVQHSVYSEVSVCDCPKCGSPACHCSDDGGRIGETISNEQLLELDVDILIPSALENQITAENAERVQAPVIVEVANGPVSATADETLNRRGALVVPDILANAGGVTVSYFEWVQNRAGYYWTEEEVQARLHRTMAREFNAIHDLMNRESIDMRTAAYAHALSRLGAAVSCQGTSRYFSNGIRQAGQ